MAQERRFSPPPARLGPSAEEEPKRPRFHTSGGRSLLHDEIVSRSPPSVTSSNSRPGIGSQKSSTSSATDGLLQSHIAPLQIVPNLPYGKSTSPFKPDGAFPFPTESSISPYPQPSAPHSARSPGMSRPQATPRASSDTSTLRRAPHALPMGDRTSPLTTLHRLPLEDKGSFAALSATAKHRGPSGADLRIETGTFNSNPPRRSAPLSPPTAIHHQGPATTDSRRRAPAISSSTQARRSPTISGMPIPTESRLTGGVVGSFFNRPPSGKYLQTRRHSLDRPIYPHRDTTQSDSESRRPLSPSELDTKLPSPIRRSASQAWFALGVTNGSRDRHGWSSDHLRAYDAGYEDAIRAIESGVVGVGNQHYRNPIMIRSGQADRGDRGGVAPNGHDNDNDNTRGSPWDRSMTNPHSSRSPAVSPHFFASRPSYGPSDSYPPSHPHAVSPYAFSSYPSSSSRPTPSSLGGPSGPGYEPYYRNSQGFYSASSGGSGRVQRQLISCYPCRRRKLKCDGARPCAQCMRRGNEAECGYATHVRRRGKGKKKDDDESSTGSSRMGSVEMARGYGSGDSMTATRDPDDHIADVNRLIRLHPSRESSYGPLARDDGARTGNGPGSRSYRIRLSPDGDGSLDAETAPMELDDDERAVG